MTLASEPAVMLDADKSVLLDATRGRRVTVNVGRNDTVLDGQQFEITTGLGNGGFGTIGILFMSGRHAACEYPNAAGHGSLL